MIEDTPDLRSAIDAAVDAAVANALAADRVRGIAKALGVAALAPDRARIIHLTTILAAILRDLPVKRDWLDPGIEAAANLAVGRQYTKGRE